MRIRVLSWNIMSTSFAKEFNPPNSEIENLINDSGYRFGQIVDYIKHKAIREQVDVICLQEVDVTDKEGWRQISETLELLKQYGFGYRLNFQHGSEEKSGLLMIYRAKNLDEVATSFGRYSGRFMGIIYNGNLIVNVHMPTMPLQEFSELMGDIMNPWKWGIRAEWRSSVADRMVIAGDFNKTPEELSQVAFYPFHLYFDQTYVYSSFHKYIKHSLEPRYLSRLSDADLEKLAKRMHYEGGEKREEMKKYLLSLGEDVEWEARDDHLQHTQMDNCMYRGVHMYQEYMINPLPGFSNEWIYPNYYFPSDHTAIEYNFDDLT